MKNLEILEGRNSAKLSSDPELGLVYFRKLDGKLDRVKIVFPARCRVKNYDHSRTFFLGSAVSDLRSGRIALPEKCLSLFEVLLFPWLASCRVVRANCLVAIGLSILLLARLLLSFR